MIRGGQIGHEMMYRHPRERVCALVDAAELGRWLMLADDYYGTYNFNRGYYLESPRLLWTADAGKPS